MKVKNIMENTSSSSDYKKSFRVHLSHEFGTCDRCLPHRGCNDRRKYGNISWKYLRKKQWK